MSQRTSARARLIFLLIFHFDEVEAFVRRWRFLRASLRLHATCHLTFGFLLLVTLLAASYRSLLSFSLLFYVT